MTGETCQTRPCTMASDPIAMTDAGTPTRTAARSCCESCARISISPPLAIRNKPPDPALTTCPTSTLRARIRPGCRCPDVETADLRTRCTELCLRDIDAGTGGVARRHLAVEVGLRDEATVDQREAAFIFVLSQRGIGARRTDLRRQLRRGLRLNRSIDRGEHLALSDPASGIDIDRPNQAAFAGHAHRLVTPRCKCARCCDGPRNFASARHGDRNGGRDAALLTASGRRAGGGGVVFLATNYAGHQQNRGHADQDGGEDDPPAAAGPINHDQGVGAFKTGFVVHLVHLSPMFAIHTADAVELYYANISLPATRSATTRVTQAKFDKRRGSFPVRYQKC